MSKKLGYGVALVGALAGAGALATALVKKKKQEELYHEAEIKAMNELDGLSDTACGCEEDECSDCVCAEVCAAMDEVCDCEQKVEPAQSVQEVTEEESAPAGSCAGGACEFEELRACAEAAAEKIREYAAAEELEEKPAE